MKKKIILGIAIFAIFSIGFISGMEYKAYEIRTAFKDAFSDVAANSAPKTVAEQAKEENLKTIQKAVGDELVMATGNLKVNSAEEKQTLSGSYGSPNVAKEGTKFVVISLDVMNTTKSAFTFSPDEVFKLIDNKGREFSTYDDSIGAVDDYLNYRELSPSVKETGFLVYEIPNDATGYSLLTAKAGTKDLYKIVIK